MRERAIINARIEGTFLGVQDHGIFTAMVYCKCQDGTATLGGRALDAYVRGLSKRVGVPYGVEFIKCVIETAGVESWEKLPGTLVRIELEGSSASVKRIGHIVEDRWFDPQELADQMAREVGMVTA